MERVDRVSYEILRFAKEKNMEVTVREICETLGLDHSAVMRSILGLEQEGYVQTFELKEASYRLTDEGKSYALEGLPERRVVETVLMLGGEATLEDIVKNSNLSEDTVKIALGWIVRKGWGKIVREGDVVKVRVETKPSKGGDEKLLRRILVEGEVKSKNLSQEEEATVNELKKRKLVLEKVFVDRVVRLTENGLVKLESGEVKPVFEEEVTALTSELIVSGRWRETKFREYDVTATPPKIYPGKKHFYLEFLDELKRILVSMGFEEADGPYVELELWNFDVLFQPQDHPAREIHDSYQIKNPRYGVLKDKKLVERVKKTHENGWVTGSRGWRYKWSFEVAKRLVMRSQTTAVSARFLSEHKNPPIKMFCVSRVFRPDVLDAKHAMEFYHCEGIVVDKNLTFKHLLGMLSEIAKALDIGRVEFKPGYFPFTEPSVEAFVYHPKIGWMEAAGAGMFRPEVTKPLGVRYPVLAWGIGVDRLAMVKLGVDDIRELHSKRLDFLRER
ncbi:MAG: phenylalanine--tRNA ligase subunit alpha [Candidatus Hecatellales archaeon]|nr:MAG: phenylalanine--tRNA ligase subunit alpha [Candidatus Hecatellales archaeon]